MPYGVRAYQLRSRASRTSRERIEKAGSDSFRNGISTASTRLIGVFPADVRPQGRLFLQARTEKATPATARGGAVAGALTVTAAPRLARGPVMRDQHDYHACSEREVRQHPGIAFDANL